MNVEARNIPAGTDVDLECFSDDGQDHTAKTSPLIGTAERSRATAQISISEGKVPLFSVGRLETFFTAMTVTKKLCVSPTLVRHIIRQKLRK